MNKNISVYNTKKHRKHPVSRNVTKSSSKSSKFLVKHPNEACGIKTSTGPFNLANPTSIYEQYKLDTSKLAPLGTGEYGMAHGVHKSNFNVLNTFTTYYVEIYDDSMRCIHMHDANELGYVADGAIEVIIWSETKVTKTLATKGCMWFIPKGALHSLNNIGEKNATLWIAFNSTNPSNTDVAVLMNGLPQYLKNEYSASPHSLLKNYVGPNYSYYFNYCPKEVSRTATSLNSPFVLSFDGINPDIYDKDLGCIKRVSWLDWPIIKGTKFSAGHISLRPRTSTDCYWYGNSDANYVIYKGSGKFFMVMTNFNNPCEGVPIKTGDFYFVPCATPHSIMNDSDSDLELVVFYSSDDHVSKISFGEAITFFGDTMIQDSLMTSSGQQYANPDKIIKNIKNIPLIFKI
jgi:oxalate decarboxylase